MGFYRFLNYITNEILTSKKLMIVFFLFGTLVFLLENLIGPPWTKEDYPPSIRKNLPSQGVDEELIDIKE